MVRILVLSLFFISFISISGSYRSFTPLGRGITWAPIPYSQAAANASRLGKGAVRSPIGRFAIATINPKNALAVGRSLARKNPYTLAVMLAAGYLFDDFDNLIGSSPELTGLMPFTAPKVEDGWSVSCQSTAISADTFFIGLLPITQIDRIDKCTQFLIPQVSDVVKPFLTCPYAAVPLSIDSVTTTAGSGGYVVRWTCPGYDPYPGDRVKSFPVSVNNVFVKSSTACPNSTSPADIQPLYTNGVISGCVNPVTYDKYQPTPLSPQAAADGFGGQLEQNPFPDWQNFLDSSGNIEPEFIQSVNEPVLTDALNNALLQIESGTFQTTQPTASNYVSPDLYNQAVVARNSMMNDQAFVDNTGAVIDPNVNSNGVSTQVPAVPSAAQNINVTVQIPPQDFLTQSQYEASNAKEYTQFENSALVESGKIDTQLQSLKDADSSFITSLQTDITNFSVPSFPTLSSIWPTMTTGSCIPFTTQVSIAGNAHIITYDQHCAPYNKYIHPMLVWFLYLSTALYVFHLAGETIGRK